MRVYCPKTLTAEPQTLNTKPGTPKLVIRVLSWGSSHEIGDPSMRLPQQGVPSSTVKGFSGIFGFQMFKAQQGLNPKLKSLFGVKGLGLCFLERI